MATITYPLTFKAAVLERTHQPLEVNDVTFPGPLETGQVLVRIAYSGICGKQIEEIDATAGPDPYLPHLLGHEGSGIVVDIGPGVTKVAPGDTVVLHWLKGSGMQSPTPRYRRNREGVNAGWVTTFNEYGVVSENRVTPISNGVDLAIAALLGCAVTTGVGVVLNDATVRPGDSVAVFGCGGVGLCAVQAAALVRGHPIIAVDPRPEGLSLARQFGATHTIDKETEVVAEMRRITNGHGARHVIVASGAPRMIEIAIQASAAPGSVFLVGVPPAGSQITVDPLAIHRRRTLGGSHGGGAWPDRDIPGYLALDQRGHLNLRELITDVIPLEQINEGLASLRRGRAGRYLVALGNRDTSEREADRESECRVPSA